MFDLELEWTEGVGGGERPHPPLCPSFWPSLTPLEQISFSSQPELASNCFPSLVEEYFKIEARTKFA